MDFIETLTENQKIIYAIAQEVLRKSPRFTIEDLFTACKRKSELSERVISTILDQLLRKKVFVPGSRLTRGTILKNERRAKIYQYITANPGLNFNQIVTQFKMGRHVGYLHLTMLEKFDLIRKRPFKIYHLYFHHTFPEEKELLMFFLRNENVLKLYRCLRYHPLNPHALSKIVKLHHSTVQYYLSELREHDIVVSDANLYNINPEHLDFLEQYYNLTPPPQMVRLIEEYLARKKEIAPTEEKMEVVRQ